MSEIVEFYAGRKKDWRGRRLEDIWAYSHDQLEDVHHFIQWLFPLRTAGVAPAALVDDEAVAAFRASPELRERLLKSFAVMLDFYGLRREGDEVVRTENFPERAANWLTGAITTSCGSRESSRACANWGWRTGLERSSAAWGESTPSAGR
jgi:hypothetical protein